MLTSIRLVSNTALHILLICTVFPSCTKRGDEVLPESSKFDAESSQDGASDAKSESPSQEQVGSSAGGETEGVKLSPNTELPSPDLSVIDEVAGEIEGQGIGDVDIEPSSSDLGQSGEISVPDVPQKPKKDAATTDVVPLCDNPKQMGDTKQPNDTCWQPPFHWCSAGAQAAIAKGCSPDGSLCCTFSSYCLPCGWINCKENPTEACATPVSPSDACASSQPDPNLIICD